MSLNSLREIAKDVRKYLPDISLVEIAKSLPVVHCAVLDEHDVYLYTKNVERAAKLVANQHTVFKLNDKGKDLFFRVTDAYNEGIYAEFKDDMRYITGNYDEITLMYTWAYFNSVLTESIYLDNSHVDLIKAYLDGKFTLKFAYEELELGFTFKWIKD